MIECPSCLRVYPEVQGAPTQVCPHCGHEVGSATDAASASMPADPVGAVALAWRVARSDYLRLLLLWLPAFAVELAAAFLLGAYARANAIAVDGAMTSGQQMQYLGVGIPLYLAVFTARLAAWTFVAARALDVALGGERLAAWRQTLPRALAVGFVLTLTYAAGWLMLIVGFLVFFHWFLYAPAMLADGARGLGAAFDRSRRFARERRTTGFTALLLLAGALFAGVYFSLAGLAGAPGILASAAWGWLVGPVLPLLAACFVAVAREAPESAVGAPAARRATTACPRCATLIPYEPTGEPVTIACPSCGTTGRVL